MLAAPATPPYASTATTEAPDVSVIIVNYNVREFLEQALESVERASAGLSVETFVVDNDSADGSVAMVRKRFPDVHVIANDHNVGFAVANNQAIREASGRHLLILNPDTVLQEDTLSTLVRFMDRHPEAGAAGCRILNPDGSFAPESRRAFPTPAVAFYRLSGLGRLFPHSPTFGRYNLTYLPKDEVCEVDALSGSCMMVRHAALYASREKDQTSGSRGDRTAPPISDARSRADGAGLFDEDFFMYGEDLDWCYRIQKAGWKIFYTPETQLVHYKGECTKKGELRYIRLFYGAMHRFVEKHLEHDTGAGVGQRVASRLLALGIRIGIVVRALFSSLSGLVESLRLPAIDFVLALLAMCAGAAAWDAVSQARFGLPYYAIVAPGYALASVVGIALAGGYRRGRPRLRAVAAGVGGALLAVATLSFFIKAIAFSRAALVVGFAGTGVLLALKRQAARRQPGTRRVLLVGSGTEASRLQRLVGGPMRPAVELVGYVADEEARLSDEMASDDSDDRSSHSPHLGRLHHLRDLVRLHAVDDVVFAADALSNTAILGLMRGLRGLPVQLKILASGRDRIIGKASVEDYSVPLLEAERSVAPLRNPFARRLLDVSAALTGLMLHPLLRLALHARPRSTRLRYLNRLASGLPDVLFGRTALVGVDVEGPHPPADWGLTPGLVSILDTRPERPSTIVDAHRAYWFYARNQSFLLDLEILVRALLRTG